MAALLALTAGSLLPSPAGAQETDADAPPPPASDTVDRAVVDSLQARLEALEARLDSLYRQLDSAAAGTPAGGETDELDDLRAAARQAAGEASGDTAGRAGGSRTRNLNRLNPEISLTGDILASLTSPADGESNLAAVPREFELSIQSALDPYSRAKVFLARHEDVEIAGLPAFGHGHADEEGGEGGHEEVEGDPAGEGAHGSVEIEEGYIEWVGLPGGLGAKFGKFRQEVGLYNRWHNHALLEVRKPLPLVAFLGEDGLTQTGVGLSFPSVTTGAGTQSAYLEVATGSNASLFEGGNELSYLGRLQSFWDLSPSTFLQFGATGVYGENEGASLETRLLEFDAYFRWQPSGEGMYRDLMAKTEWYVVEKEEAGRAETARGGYLQLNYELDRRWTVGARADYLEPFGDGREEIVQLVPSVTWWQSEWVRLRLQYNHVRSHGEGNHTLTLQSVWAVGPHKHQTY